MGFAQSSRGVDTGAIWPNPRLIRLPSVIMADPLIAQLSEAETLTELPAIVDISQRTPPNPPARIQEQFVGQSYEAAYAEALSFAHVVAQWSTESGLGALPTLDRILDFGSGWGRITRVLLAEKVHPRHIIAADVDQEMTALVNVTLPGITTLTVDPMPPTVLNNATLDLVTAYSVFSHLSPAAHQAWAQEFGRLLVDGGLVVLTVLDRAFFEQIQWSMDAVKKGDATPAAHSLAGAFPDLAAATAAFDQGGIAYAGTGGGGVRTGDFYGWAAASKQHIEDTWSKAGFDIVQWVPSGVLFNQAAVALRRRTRVAPGATWHDAIAGAQAVQEQFVGQSYEAAYAEALSFAHVVAQWSTESGLGALPTLDRILDFGSGWGRITRVLLAEKVHPRHIIAADVDQEMTALVNVTLPGITTLTVDPMPPTVLNNATLDLVTAYSVFSHLSPAAHQAWAQEFGRLLVDGGLVVLTVLDRAFFEQIQWSMDAVKKGDATPAAHSLAGAFPDLAAATAAFDQGGIAYAGTGGGGVRTGDFYGWAAASKQHIEDTWSKAGFDIVQWVPSGVLFNQAAVALRRRTRVV